jgi:hypothetical protein
VIEERQNTLILPLMKIALGQQVYILWVAWGTVRQVKIMFTKSHMNTRSHPPTHPQTDRHKHSHTIPDAGTQTSGKRYKLVREKSCRRIRRSIQIFAHMRAKNLNGGSMLTLGSLPFALICPRLCILLYKGMQNIHLG